MTTLWQYNDEVDGTPAQLSFRRGASLAELTVAYYTVRLPEAVRRDLWNALVATLPDETPACTCHTSTAHYDGPDRDCPIHGEVPTPLGVLTRLTAPEGAAISATIHGKATWRDGLLQLVTANGTTRNIPGEAEVTVLAEPELELLTELVDSMTARTPDSRVWRYVGLGVWWNEAGGIHASTEHLIGCRAVIVR